MRVRKHKQRRPIYYISILSLAVSLSFIVYSVIGIVTSNLEIRCTLSKWDNEIRSETESINTEKSISKGTGVTGTSQNGNNGSTGASGAEKSGEFKIAGDICGAISFPSLNERTAILEGTESEQLKRGTGHYSGTSSPGGDGNCVLTGHNDTVFKNIGKLKIGDRIELETLSGKYEYRVLGTKIVNESDISCLDSTSGPTLTLITCYPFYYIGDTPERYVVTARLQ